MGYFEQPRLNLQKKNPTAPSGNTGTVGSIIWLPSRNKNCTKSVKSAWEVTPYYTRLFDKRPLFVRGEKPTELAEIAKITARAMANVPDSREPQEPDPDRPTVSQSLRARIYYQLRQGRAGPRRLQNQGLPVNFPGDKAPLRNHGFPAQERRSCRSSAFHGTPVATADHSPQQKGSIDPIP